MRVKFTVTVENEAVEDLIDKYNLDLLIEKYKEKELMKNEKKKRTSFI